MYIPSFPTIAPALGLAEVALEPEDNTTVSVSQQTLRLLLQFVALAADYDEATYLRENPDVAEAYEGGRIADLHLHFVRAGYLEGRRASEIRLDEGWYTETYPDVADAIGEGAIESARAHFTLRGETEMRSPNAESLPWIQAWAEALAARRPAPRAVSHSRPRAISRG